MFNITSNILYLFFEQSRQPYFTPSGSFFVFVNERKRDKLANCRVESIIDLNLSIFTSLFDVAEGLVGLEGVEGVFAFVEEVEDAACGPDVAFEGIFLV